MLFMVITNSKLDFGNSFHFFFNFKDLLLVKNIQRALAIAETGYTIMSTLGLNS